MQETVLLPDAQDWVTPQDEVLGAFADQDVDFMIAVAVLGNGEIVFNANSGAPVDTILVALEAARMRILDERISGSMGRYMVDNAQDESEDDPDDPDDWYEDDEGEDDA